RRGRHLASGEDNDIVLTLMSNGYRAAYIPLLVLWHLIPSRRVSPGYLGSLGYAAMRTFYLVLYLHGVANVTNEPPVPTWSLAHRKLIAFWRRRAWRSWPHFISWRQDCGLLEGRADVYRLQCRSHHLSVSG